MKLTISAEVSAPIKKIWDAWNNPKHIVNWSFAGDYWHSPKSSNDLKIWGTFSTTMAARDGSMSFDFEWEYTDVIEHKKIDYTIIDMQYWEYYIEKWRKVSIFFEELWDNIRITETFDAEDIHSEEMQKAGWQMILNRFKNYVEDNNF